jgi:hypothetical protein
VTTPKQANAPQRRDAPRTYSWPPIPPHEFESISVTSAIKGGLPTPHLIGWAAKVTAEAAVDDHELLTMMLAKPNGQQMAIDHLKGSRFRDMSAKADRGTIVHAALEAYAEDKPLSKETVEEKLKEARVPFEMWKSTAAMIVGVMEFLHATEPEIFWSEQTVYSRSHGYAGTPDLVAKMSIGGSRVPVIIDVKTSKRIYDEVGLQLVAYAKADFVGLDDGTEAPLVPGGEKIEYGVAVRPTASGKFEAVTFALTPELFELYLGCLKVASSKDALAAARRPS